MMVRYPAIVIVAVLLLSSLSVVQPAAAETADAPEPIGDRAQAKWTYMVYMSADNNLEDEAILNVNQMEAVGSSDDLSIVIMLDRSPQYDETNGNWNGTRRYYVTADTDPLLISSQLVQDMGEVDMGDGDVLRDYVVWAIGAYPADRYYLDVWGHGGGWRDGTCNDYTSGTVIDTDELGVALAEAREATNVTLDGVGFDQCLMAQLEVYYEIKAIADVLVGAETLIPADGYNYTRVFEPLAADPEMTPTELGELLVTAFFDEYGHVNARAHSSVDAEELDARLAPAVNWLAQLLRGKADTLHDEIKWARDYAQTYSTIDYIDLGNFTERLLGVLDENETGIRQAAREVRENVTAAVIAEDHGNDREGSTGLSFYFPEWRAAWSYSQLAMSGEQRWDEFLDAYFDRRDRPNVAPVVSVDSPYPMSTIGLEVILSGKAFDPDGNVTDVEWKIDREPWESFPAGSDWNATVSTRGMAPGLHRLSVRAVDDKGDRSREVQFQVNVQTRGFHFTWQDPTVMTYPGGETSPTLRVRRMDQTAGLVLVEVDRQPANWSVVPRDHQVPLTSGGTTHLPVDITVDEDAPIGIYRVLMRGWLMGEPLIQVFASLTVNVTEKWPDLRVIGLRLDPGEPKQGEEARVKFAVLNEGYDVARDFDIELRYTRLGDGDNQSGVPSLLAAFHYESMGPMYGEEFSTPWTAELGVHEFLVVVDPLGNNSDLIPENNVRALMYVLEGYGVDLEVPTQQFVVSPGDEVNITLTVRNVGNLDDVVQLRHVESTLNWGRAFDQDAFHLNPNESREVVLTVRVPPFELGGVVCRITVQASSAFDPSKAENVTLWLVIPEVFGLNVSKDKSGVLVAPLGTESFNISIENTGNGMETYSIDYAHQTEDLLVSAENDTIEVAPGCSTQVEVFVSGLGTPVGGETFQQRFTVRSEDDPTIVEVLWLNVTVRKDSSLTASIFPDSIEGFPGSSLDVTLLVGNGGNHNISVEAYLLGPPVLFDPQFILLADVGPGKIVNSTFNPILKRDVEMGEYTMAVSVESTDGSGLYAYLELRVFVNAIHAHSFAYNSSSDAPLSQGSDWMATLLLSNKGNHPETYALEVTGAPEWMVATLSQPTVTLPAFSTIMLVLDVSLGGDEMDAPETVMLVITATPANATGAVPTVVLDVPLDVDTGEVPGSTWLMWVTMALVVIVLMVTLALFRWRR